MPIKNISTIRRFPRIGKVHLGLKQIHEKSQFEYPVPTDYFVVKADETTPESAAKAFHKRYGDKPRQLSIMFPTEDMVELFPQYYKYYRSGIGLYCKGDGEQAMRVEEKEGKLVKRTCPCDHLETGRCRQVASLMFLLPDVPGLGAWQLDTSSFHSIVNINSGMDFIRGITGGRLAMIPLQLRLIEKMVAPGGKKKTVHVLDLVHEEITLSRLLEAARAPVTQALAPPLVDDNEVPSDLFPEVVVPVMVDEATGEVMEEAEAGPANSPIESDGVEKDQGGEGLKQWLEGAEDDLANGDLSEEELRQWLDQHGSDMGELCALLEKSWKTYRREGGTIRHALAVAQESIASDSQGPPEFPANWRMLKR